MTQPEKKRRPIRTALGIAGGLVELAEVVVTIAVAVGLVIAGILWVAQRLTG